MVGENGIYLLSMKETKFKHTEIGLIPEDWEVKSLVDATPLQRGFDLPKAEQQIGSYPVVYSNGICSYHNKFMIKGPGVVTGRSGTIGSVHYIESDYWPHNTTLWVTKFNGNYPLYVYYLFQTIDWKLYSTGSGVPTLNRNDVHEKLLPFPTYEEQSRIATALYDIDTLIRNLDRTIEKKQNIKLGAMQELLSSQKRLKGFAEEWKEMSLEEMGFLTAGGTPSTMNPEYWGGDINWLQSGAVQNCLIMPDAVEKKITRAGLQNSSAYLIRPNSVLIAITGATCANVGFLTFESAANQSVVSIEPYEDYDAMFLYQKLLTEKTNILSNKGGSAQSGVTLKALKQLTILVPPTIQEQRAIADLLTAMDDEIAVLQMERDKYANIRSGMMDDLLSGAKRI